MAAKAFEHYSNRSLVNINYRKIKMQQEEHTCYEDKNAFRGTFNLHLCILKLK